MTYLHKLNANRFEEYFINLSKKIGADIVENAIYIPSQIGSGYIKNLVIEEHFCIRYFNVLFKKDIEIEFQSTQEEQEVLYKLLFNLDSKEHETQDGSDFHSNNSNIILYSTDFMRTGIIRRNVNFRRIAIIFSADWLKENYKEASIRMNTLVEGVSTKQRSTILSENMDTQNRFIVTQLANEMDRKLFAQLHVKTASFMLLNDFLNKIVKRNRQDILSDQTLHYYTMIKVEEKIMQSLNHKLPNLDQLAIEFNLSLSTLKRHFRIVFGKNIYQYYQEKRMEWGKAKLEKGDCGIGEIATQLGFYKINNFSIAFKKYFGVLPRELKHRSFIHINS